MKNEPVIRKILILSASLSNCLLNYINEVVATQKLYAQQRGYDYKFYEGKCTPQLNKSICKFNYILKHLSFYEYVMWMNDNTVPVNSSYDLDNIIEVGRNTDILLCRDQLLTRPINTDVLLVKNTKWSHENLQQLVARLTSDSTINEQDYIEQLIEDDLPDYKELIDGKYKQKIDWGIPQKTFHFTIFNEHWFNSANSPFIVTLQDKNNEEKIQFLNHNYQKLLLTKNISLNHRHDHPVWGENFQKIPQIQPRKQSFSVSITKIPKRIIQTFETSILPKDIIDCVNLWITMNPDYEHNYYDDSDCRYFLKKYFAADVLTAYDTLIPGAYKADLFRYCALYIYGGVYADIRTVPYVPLSDVFDDEYDFVTTVDRSDNALLNNFICCIPKHPFLQKAIELTVDNIKNRFYGNSWLDITGPVAMCRAVNSLLGLNLDSSFQPGIHQLAGFKVKLLAYPKDKNHIKDSLGKVIYAPRDSNSVFATEKFFFTLTGKKPYAWYWLDKEVYQQLTE